MSVILQVTGVPGPLLNQTVRDYAVAQVIGVRNNMMSYTMKDMMKKLRYRDGFTLMELLIVMVILAVLVAIATGTYASSSRRGRDNRRKNDLRNLTTALETYYSDKGRYPTSNSAGEMVGCCASPGCGDVQVCEWGGQFKDTNGTLYMVLTPEDPLSSQTYFYEAGTDSYRIYAKLENTLDEGDNVNQSGYTGTDCSLDSAVACTYGISSSNTTP